jgi:hypothetical protein
LVSRWLGGKTIVSDTPGQACACGIVAVHQSVADIGAGLYLSR